jgi:hypothetical protein
MVIRKHHSIPNCSSEWGSEDTIDFGFMNSPAQDDSQIVQLFSKLQPENSEEDGEENQNDNRPLAAPLRNSAAASKPNPRQHHA